ncbi:MAG TPA: aminodeoxychorismate lyase [Angustibacter sp.]|nr:aminodeoxychorismate lyase [Angustibacter sp.]
MVDALRVWVDGRLVDPDDPAISALDHGLTVGDGVFETLKVVDGQPFALTRHLRRLATSAAGLGLVPPDVTAVREGMSAVLAGDPIGFGRLRVTMTGGHGPLGSDRGDSPPTYVVVASPVPRPEPSTAVSVVPWTRNERSAVAGLKTTSYAENVVALAYARQRGASEALFTNTRGHLCEGTGSNVFVAVDGRLVTPPLSSGCLAGITRELLIEWAIEDGLEVVEAELGLDDLRAATEVLLTSSTRDVQPVRQVDDRRLEAPGTLGAVAAELFRRRAGDDIDP